MNIDERKYKKALYTWWRHVKGMLFLWMKHNSANFMNISRKKNRIPDSNNASASSGSFPITLRMRTHRPSMLQAMYTHAQTTLKFSREKVWNFEFVYTWVLIGPKMFKPGFESLYNKYAGLVVYGNTI